MTIRELIKLSPHPVIDLKGNRFYIDDTAAKHRISDIVYEERTRSTYINNVSVEQDTDGNFFIWNSALKTNSHLVLKVMKPLNTEVLVKLAVGIKLVDL